MIRASLFLFTLCAMIAGGTGYLVERGFTPKKKYIELSALSRVMETQKPEELKSVEPKAEPKVVKKESDLVKAIELSAADFIPAQEPELELTEEVSIAYHTVEKDFKVQANLEHSEELVENFKNNLEKSRKDISVSEVEINGSDLVKLYAFKATPVKASDLVANFKPIDLEKRFLNTQKLIAAKEVKLKEKFENKTSQSNDKSNGKTEDRISTAMSATEKSNPTEVTQKNIVEDATKVAPEEMVFFDYSVEDVEPVKAEQTIVESQNQKAMASLVKVGSAKKTLSPVVNSDDTQQKGPTKDKDLQQNILGEILKGMGKEIQKPKSVAKAPSAPPIKKSGANKAATAPEPSMAFDSGMPFEKKMNTQNHNSVYRLTTQSMSFNAKNSGDIKNFEVRFFDDLDDIRRSDSTGVVVLEDSLNTSYAVRRGTIFASGHYPVTTDFVLEGHDVNIRVPLPSEESFQQLVEKLGITGLGGHILIELDELTEDAALELDTVYEEKLFLDRSLKVVDRGDSDYSYIMFVGVVPGNKIISFRTYRNEVTSKIVHISEDEIYFDTNFYNQVESDEFELFEENLLSKETGLLSVNENEIVDLAYDTKFTKKTVNRFQLGKSLYPVGARKYYELKHLNESVFVGRWDSDYIDVPSESYMRFAISNFGGYSLQESCVVQINLEKQAKELSYNGQSNKGNMRIEARILDTDGVFYKDLSDQSKRIFLLGEEQGSLNIKIKYVDNSVDYLQTFCSKSNYVVEQL